MNTQTMKTPIEYIKEAWGIYTKKENFIFFARIMAVIVIISTSISYLLSYYYSPDDWQNIGFVALTMLLIVVGLWSQTTQYFAVLKIGNPPAGGEKDIFKLGFKNMTRFLFISFVVGLIVLGGAILLIIPAIIFGVWFSFATFLVLDKNMKIKEALKTSKLMVNDKFFLVLGRFVVFGLFTFVVSLILTIVPYIGSLIVSFVAPLFMLPFYLLYRDLGASGRLDDFRTA